MTSPTPQDVREIAARAVLVVQWGRNDADWSQLNASGREHYLEIADAVLAAVSPVIRQQVAEEIASDLMPEESDRPYFGDGYWLALRDAAAIARSHSQPTEETNR